MTSAGAATRIVPIDTWNILRDGLYGDWYWNPDAKSISAINLGAENKLDLKYFLTRTWPRPLAERIANSRYVEVAGGMVPLPDQMPERFADLVTDFLQRQAGA